MARNVSRPITFLCYVAIGSAVNANSGLVESQATVVDQVPLASAMTSAEVASLNVTSNFIPGDAPPDATSVEYVTTGTCEAGAGCTDSVGVATAGAGVVAASGAGVEGDSTAGGAPSVEGCRGVSVSATGCANRATAKTLAAIAPVTPDAAAMSLTVHVRGEVAR